jgi:dihydrofolate synthase/folylpolyglutamate synthase
MEEDSPICYAEKYIQVTFKKYENGCMVVETSDNKNYQIGLTGFYQLKNIATTLTAIDQLNELDFTIPNKAIEKGLKEVTEITGLQGRWQILGHDPLVIADTGHNVAGFQYIVEQIKAQKCKTLRIVIGMVNDKDIRGVLALLPVKAQYYFTQAAIERALPAIDLKEKGEMYHLKGMAYSSVKQAVKAALNEADQKDFIFIGGSNFVVGEALSNRSIKSLSDKDRI